MAGTLKVDSINADSNLALKIANTAVAFIDATGLRPTSGNVSLDATATSKFYLPSANTVAIQTAGVTAVTVDSSQNTTLAGTASATKLIPTGSSATGTGMYLPAANSLGLSTNGNNAVYIDSSQKVGIGTTSPTAKLTVSTNSNNEGVIRVSDNATYYGELSRINASDEVRLGSYGASQNMTFYTVASERMRIDSGGKVTVGSTAQTKGNFNLFGPSSTQLNLYLFKDAQVEAYMGFNSSDSNLYVNSGATFATNGVYMVNGGTSWVTNSDERLKENLVPITDAITKVSSLRTVIGNFIADENKTARPFLIAQDVQAVLPEAISTSTMNETEYLGVSYTDVIPLLVASIKELKALNDTQAATIAALTARIVALETT